MYHETEHRSFGQPDETREFPHGKAEIVSMGGAEVGRMTFEPGWRWSDDVKPIARTDSCEAPHFQYHVSGQLAIRMDDGTEMLAKPGDVTSLPSGHDAWVVGDEPVVVVRLVRRPATTQRPAHERGGQPTDRAERWLRCCPPRRTRADRELDAASGARSAVGRSE